MSEIIILLVSWIAFPWVLAMYCIKLDKRMQKKMSELKKKRKVVLCDNEYVYWTK